VAEGAQGEPIWDVVVRYLKDRKVITPRRLSLPRLEGVAGNPGIG
jgi:sulfur-oxidizing protein SoxB